MREPYEEQFKQFTDDISRHTVTVLRDDGLYRHLRCSSGSYCYQFDVITWPGYLAYCGDMGTFVFSRLPDMFEFFGGRRGAMIDRQYLAEKSVAVDKQGGLLTFSQDRFEAAVKDCFETFADDMDDQEKADLWEGIRREVLSVADEGLGAAVRAAMDFRHGRHEVFPDFYEHRLEEYTSRFVWACYAIPWAIEQYGELKRSAQPELVGAVDPHAGTQES